MKAGREGNHFTCAEPREECGEEGRKGEKKIRRDIGAEGGGDTETTLYNLRRGGPAGVSSVRCGGGGSGAGGAGTSGWGAKDEHSL